MAKYLIVGLPGVGKTTLLAELRLRGYATMDADFEPELTGWIDKKTGKLVAAWSDGQRAAPEGYVWGWDRARLHELTRNPPGDPFYFGGNTAGMEQYYILFDEVFALVASDATIQKRLTDAARNNPHNYGQKPEHVVETLVMNRTFLEQETNRGAIIIDAEPPVNVIADEILRLSQAV